MKHLTIIVLIFIIASCSHTRNFSLVEFENGEMLQGTFNSSTQEAIVVMLDGQILKGKYTRVKNATFTFAKSFYAYSTSMSGNAYALLKSESSKLMMEIIVIYQKHHGFGEARTNDGRIYKVQF